MTKRKLPPHRIGLTSPDVRNLTKQDIREQAQHIFLLHVAKLAPDVLRTLADVPPGYHSGIDDDELNASLAPVERQPECDEEALAGWAAHWNLSADWCFAHGRATWRMWRRFPNARRTYWSPRDDKKGALYRPRPGRQAGPMLKSPEHFTWLVRYQVLGDPYLQIASEARKACVALADLLKLGLRPAEKGWTRHNKVRQRARTQ
jgi:hypothetical protein